MTPATINPLTLPSSLLKNRALFPATPCIYFAIDSQGVVQYIGRTVNLRQRWVSHHRQAQLEEMEEVRVAYLSVDSPDILPAIEKALIEWCKPPLNGYRIDGDQPRRTHKYVLRLTPEEYEAIETAAKVNGISIAAYIRQATYKQLKQDNPNFDPSVA